MVNIFSGGSCLNFYFILRRVWPQAIPFYNINHIITKIDDRYYDITGDVTNLVKKDGYSPFHSWYDYKRTRRAISQMMRAEFNVKKHEYRGN